MPMTESAPAAHLALSPWNFLRRMPYPGARNFARKGQSITFTYDDPDSGEAVDVLLKPEK